MGEEAQKISIEALCKAIGARFSSVIGSDLKRTTETLLDLMVEIRDASMVYCDEPAS
jgi:hypothetical protein